MSNLRHSPAPWNLHPVMQGENDLKCECGGRTYLYSDRYIAAGEKVIARVYMVNNVEAGGFPHVDNREEFIANVDLMLAAPEMLEDIRELRSTLKEVADCSYTRHIAKDALTKTEKYA